MMPRRIRKISLIALFLVLAGTSVYSQVTAVMTHSFTNESNIRSFSNTVTITVDGDTLINEISTDGTAAAAFLAGFSGGSAAFNAMVSSLDETSITLSEDDSVATITFLSDISYYITADESISFTIPAASLKTSSSDVAATPGITIANEDPEISIVAESYSEASIRASSLNFDITLSGDEWEDPLSADFKDGIVSGGNWDSQITPYLVITRSSATVVNVSIPAIPGFNIDATENVYVTVAAANLQHTSSGTYSSSESKTILPETVSVTASATFDGLTESDIRSNSYTITLTLTEDSWDAAVGTNSVTNRNLIQGLSFSASQSSVVFENAILGSDFGETNTSVAGSVVTITVPAIPGFDITEAVDVSIEVPASALVASSTSLTHNSFASIDRIDPYMVIETVPASPINSSDLDNATLNVKLYEETWTNSTFDKDNFSFDWNPADAAVLNVAANGDVSYVNSTEVNITLNYVNTLTENKTFTMTVLAAELSGSSDLTSQGPGVSVIAVIDPIITGVSIPNTGMGAGETITATLTVSDDHGQVFTLVGGTIAGRTVYNLQRISTTTYTVQFDIGVAGTNLQYAASDAIPYTDLQLQNGVLTGLTYSGTIVQDSDEIDTQPPVITLVSMNNGSYNVGDQVVVTIQSSEAALTFNSSTTVNTIPLSNPAVTGYVAGSGVYMLYYMVQEGNPDVVSPNPMPLSIVFEDQVGNVNTAITSYTGSNPVIDANSPLITSVDETSSGVFVPGQQVVFTINAGETGLSLGSSTTVNSIGVGSGRLALSGIGAGVYELRYTIASNDDEVSAGNLPVSLEMKDAAGNSTVFAGVVANRDVEIITSVPEASIYSEGEVCLGEALALIVNVSGGQAPYTVTLNEDGSLFGNYVTDGDNYEILVTPTEDRRYTIARIEDNIGNVVFPLDYVDVVVNPLPLVSFSPGIRTVFSLVSGGSYLLSAIPSGGVFTGPGVISSESRFYPEVAGASDSLGIIYTYTDPTTGCTGADTIKFVVLASSGGLTVNYPDAGREGIICYDDPNVTVEGENSDNLPGTFRLYRVDRTLKVNVLVDEGIIDSDLNDNQAIINLSVLDPESNQYTVEYEYSFKGELLTIEENFEFDYIKEIVFGKTTPASKCVDESSVSLTATPNENGSFKFTGNGISGSEILGYSFSPGLAPIGDNAITYTFTSDAGCIRTDYITIINYDVPEVHFTPKDVCVLPVDNETGEGGGPIGFTNLTTKPALVEKWIWEFGDYNSGEDNYDTIDGSGFAPDIIHDYTAPGSRTVSLKVLTFDGCDAVLDSVIEFADKPIANWRALSDCWIEGESINIKNLSESDKPWNTFEWKINNVAKTWDTTFNTTVLDSMAHVFFRNVEEDYQVQLIASNTTGGDLHCYDTLTDQDFIIKPTLDFDDSGYLLMTFDDSNEKWSVDSASSISSWMYGQPTFSGYESEAGNNAWYTTKNSLMSENSWIQSQCFDLRGLDRPMIRMDIMRSFDQNRDGAVLQYSLDNGANWSTLGNIDEGINWYNEFNIINRPGGGKDGAGSAIGWSGEDEFDPDTAWITVAHDLNTLLDQRLVIFGIFYATDGASVVENQGIAIDNIYIGERSKHALIEHFTNASDPASLSADAIVNNFVSNNELDVTSLQYHMSYPGDDPMNEENPAPASSRAFYYGENDVPFALLNGGLEDEYRYDFQASIPLSSQLLAVTLESPQYDMEVNYHINSDNVLSARISVIALEEIDSTTSSLHLAIVDKSRDVEIGGTSRSFTNVVMDMLPTAGGEIIQQEWSQGEELKKYFNWDVTEDTDLSDIMLVAFLQDRETGKVLQVVSQDIPEFPVPVTNRQLARISVYPNPVTDRLYITPGQDMGEFTQFQVMDMTGRIVQTEIATRVSNLYELNTSHLKPGNYQLVCKYNGSVVARSRFVKL